MNALIVNGRIFALPEEICTAEAARIIGCHPSTVVKMCDSGILREGQDWRKLPTGPNGPYLIRRDAVLDMRAKG